MYNSIMGRPMIAKLGDVSSIVDIKMKYDVDKREVATIKANQKACHSFFSER
jgi:hypothetical protein